MKFCSTCNKTFAEGQTFCPDDGEVLSESPESFVGRVIDGKYRVEGFIAQGGMGAVYRARHILLGDEVVIKTLRSEMRSNAEWLKRFQREGKAARAFRHPNSVTVYDLSSGSDGQVYMVMEYVEGHTLDKELKARGRFTPGEALEVLEPVADVLDAAHARGVVHRDLKPENIMLGSDGRGGTVVKVLDLGIAKIVGGDVHATGVTSLTIAGQILGTPYYMSPEQWGELPRDGNAEVDGRTDVYSLGVIFFELVAGRKPLTGTTLPELRQKHVAVTPPPLGGAGAGVPEEFSLAVARAMAKDRADRPQTAGEFIEELRAALGLPPRTRARGIHSTDAGASQSSGPRTREVAAGGVATSNLVRDTRSAGRESATAETIVTSEAESPGAGRETSAGDSRRVTSGGVRREGARATVTSESRADTGYFDGGQETSQQGAGVSVTAPEPRRSLAPLLAGGAVALLLVLGVGGWLVLKGRRAETQPTPTPAPPQPARPPAVARAEAASLWFEAFEKPEDAAGKRVAESPAALKSGQRFRFHFIPKTRGYLYIVGPAAGGNAQVMLLTARGAGKLKTNLVGGGADFAFPSMGGARLKLDDNPGADEFTFIFSPTPIASPAFLAGEYLHELTPAEVKELEDFRAQFKSDAPEVTVRGDGDDRRIVVLAPEPAIEAGRPLIYDVRIDHR
ncbi:MAG TPA: protein kinase [Pyrinomonadaceae bacterium]|nr:protein kinase [Pyrinomonadaceae bacterium]